MGKSLIDTLNRIGAMAKPKEEADYQALETLERIIDLVKELDRFGKYMDKDAPLLDGDK